MAQLNLEKHGLFCHYDYVVLSPAATHLLSFQYAIPIWHFIQTSHLASREDRINFGKVNPMASVNKVILVGNLGADPETRYMPNGDAVANIRLATTESWKDKASGEKKELTEWHRVVFYRKLAETVGQFLKKGSAIYVEGRIRTRKWQDKEGQERYTTEIEANEMQMLGGRSNNEGGASRSESSGSGGGGNEASTPPATPARKAPSFEDMDDDIPFTRLSLSYDPMFIRATSTRAQRRRV